MVAMPVFMFLGLLIQCWLVSSYWFCAWSVWEGLRRLGTLADSGCLLASFRSLGPALPCTEFVGEKMGMLSPWIYLRSMVFQKGYSELQNKRIPISSPNNCFSLEILELFTYVCFKTSWFYFFYVFNVFMFLNVRICLDAFLRFFFLFKLKYV